MPKLINNRHRYQAISLVIPIDVDISDMQSRSDETAPSFTKRVYINAFHQHIYHRPYVRNLKRFHLHYKRLWMVKMTLRYVPPKVRWFLRKTLRKLYYFPVDLTDWVLKRHDPLTPPRGKVYVGNGAFKKIGERLTQQFVELGGIQTDDTVLDIGCGIGRAAVPLTKLLTKGGRYYGFDTEKEGIEWCQKQITPQFPNFQFELADV